MKVALSLFIGFFIAAILFYFAAYEDEFSYLWMVILLFAIVGEFALIANMRKRGSGKLQSNDGEDSTKVDFSKNSPTINPEDMEEPPMVKPIDLTGNVFEHNFETLEDDLSFLKKENKDS